MAGELRAELHDDGDGFFSGLVPLQSVPEYRLSVAYDGAVQDVEDAYRFLPALGDLDLHLIGEGRHEELWQALGARTMTHQGVAGTRFTVWAPDAQGVRLAGTFNFWDGTGAPSAPSAPPASGSCSCRASARASCTSSRSPGRTGPRRSAPTPWPAAPRSPEHVLHRHRLALHLGRRGVARPTPPSPRPQGPVLRLRAPSRLLAPGPDVPPARRTTPRLHQGLGLHPRRTDAGRRAPLRRLMGLPGHRLLRPDRPPRHPRRLQVPRRLAAPGRYRRPHGLGAGPLPARRLGVGRVRRPPPVRARGPAPRRAPRLGHPGVRLRPPRGPQLPCGERRLLVRGVPHRRPARGRGRLDALPRLLTRARPVDPERARRPGEPRRRGLPPGDERDRVPQGARCRHHRRGVDRLGRRHPRHAPHRAGRIRRPGLRVEVEHGLDARLAGLHVPRAGAPQVPPPRDDVLDGVRVQRELRPADLARRGRPRQAVTRLQDARRLVAAARQPPRLPRLHVGPPRQATPLHGAGVRPGRRVVRDPRPRLVLLDPAYGAEADHRGVRNLVRDLNTVYRHTPALWQLDTDPAGFQWITGDSAEDNVLAFLRYDADGSPSSPSATSPPSSATTTASAPPTTSRPGTKPSTPTPPSTAAATSPTRPP